MTGFRKVVRCLAAPLAAIFFLTTSGIGVAYAGLVTTDEAVEQDRIQVDRQELLSLIEREDIRQELMAYGVDPDEASERIAALSDEELRQVMDKVDELPAGESTFGIIVGAAVIVFIVLVITDIAGYTNIFNFTN